MKYLSVVLVSSVLAACGGGGGGDSDAPASTVSVNAAVTRANQDVVAQDTVTASTAPLSSADFLTGAQVTEEGVVFNMMRAQISKLPAYMASLKANSTVTGVVETYTRHCLYGGTLVVKGTDADNNGLVTAGDRLTITSNGCKESEGTLSGSLDFVFTSISGEIGSNSYSAAMTVNFNDFAVTSAQYSEHIDGSMALSSKENGINMSTTDIESQSLSVSATYAGVTQKRTLTNYKATAQRTPDRTYNFVTSHTLSGLLTSTSISSQTVAFSTPVPLVTRSMDYYPSSGVMLITGANSSKLRVTALSNTQVRQELDANGDGEYEDTKSVSWNTLM